MTETTVPSAGTQAAREVLEDAEEHLRRTIRALNDLIEEVEAGQSERARMLRGALTDLAKAVQTAFEERSRVERRLREGSGGNTDYALDLDAACLEIGRRLDRLRTVRGPDTFPEQSG